MGCKWCGEYCDGPLSMDDCEASCGCDCHTCPDCGSAYCVNVGGTDSCETDDDDCGYWLDDRGHDD